MVLLFAIRCDFEGQLDFSQLESEKDIQIKHQSERRLVLKAGRRLLVGIAEIHLEANCVTAKIGMSPRLLSLVVVPMLIIISTLAGYDGAVINAILAASALLFVISVLMGGFIYIATEASKDRLQHAIREALVKS